MDICTSMHYYLQKYHFYILYDIYGNSRGREGFKKKFFKPNLHNEIWPNNKTGGGVIFTKDISDTHQPLRIKSKNNCNFSQIPPKFFIFIFFTLSSCKGLQNLFSIQSFTSFGFISRHFCTILMSIVNSQKILSFNLHSVIYQNNEKKN